MAQRMFLPLLFILGVIIILCSLWAFTGNMLSYIAVWSILIIVSAVLPGIALRQFLVQKTKNGVDLQHMNTTNKEGDEILPPDEAREWLDDFLVEQQSEEKEDKT